MSFLARSTFRTLSRSAPRTRGYTTAGKGSNYQAEFEALQHHAADTTDLWRKISYYACFPAVAVVVAWVYNVEKEHAEHTEHLKHENDGKLPEVPAYEYMNKRAKPFPWGMNTLFYNPHVNKDMNGAED